MDALGRPPSVLGDLYGIADFPRRSQPRVPLPILYLPYAPLIQIFDHARTDLNFILC